jgi:hypothetical protein
MDYSISLLCDINHYKFSGSSIKIEMNCLRTKSDKVMDEEKDGVLLLHIFKITSSVYFNSMFVFYS